MKRNSHLKSNQSQNSFDWLTKPADVYSKEYAEDRDLSQVYFCECCTLIQRAPTKHCKLCEGCCMKFDHHCLFILNCVGLGNHRPFMNFLLSSMLSILIFQYNVYIYLNSFTTWLAEVKSNTDTDDIDSPMFIYYAFASTKHIWIIKLFSINFFGFFMAFTLFVCQLRNVSLGYTQQFPPPFMFSETNKSMKTFFGAFMHRLANLKVFYFGTLEENDDLYFKQQNNYHLYNDKHNPKLTGTDTAIPMPGLYPRDNFIQTANNLMENKDKNNDISINLGNINNNLISSKTVEIDLD
jgi:hypothetical protein